MSIPHVAIRFAFFLMAGSVMLTRQGSSFVSAQSVAAEDRYYWVAVQDGQIPENAIPFGESTTRITGGGTRRAKIYIARGYFDEQRTSIAIADHNGCRGTAIHNRSRERIVHQFSRFDVLVPAAGFRPSWETTGRRELDHMTDEQAASLGVVKITVTFDGPEFTGFPVQFEWANKTGSSFRPAFYSGPTAFPGEQRQMNLRPVDSFDNRGDEGQGFRYLVMRPVEAASGNIGSAPPVPPDSF
ncbi:MAG: hypothetical protein KDA91_14465 [Planctomycetaceae bacterium]|nr:hypothetical protein [Planctomycetaceae bacterium]